MILGHTIIHQSATRNICYFITLFVQKDLLYVGYFQYQLEWIEDFSSKQKKIVMLRKI